MLQKLHVVQDGKLNFITKVARKRAWEQQKVRCKIISGKTANRKRALRYIGNAGKSVKQRSRNVSEERAVGKSQLLDKNMHKNRHR